jgi:hypothetical protein
VNNQAFDFGRALTYMFEEEDWVTKFLIAAGMVLLSFLIVPFFFLQGYVIEIIRRVSGRRKPYLPAWDNWGQYLSEGFMAALALFVYSLPTVLLACCMGISIAAMTDPQTGEMTGGAALLMCCTIFLILLIQIPIYLVYYAGLMRYAQTRQFNSFFQFGQLWRYVRANLGLYGYALLTIILASFVGSFIPVLGQAWAFFVTGHALGQIARTGPGGTGPVPPATGTGGPEEVAI